MIADSSEPRKSEFREELCQLLNRYNRENKSNTPDFILCRFLADCLNAFDIAVRGREEWYGKASTLGCDSSSEIE